MFMSKAAVLLSAILVLSLTQSQPARAQEQTTSSRITVDPQASEAAANQPMEMPEAAQASTTSSAAALSYLSGPNASSPVLASTGTVVLATWDGGQLTNEEVSRTLQMRKPRSMGDILPEQLAGSPAPKQREIIRDLAYELILYEKAKAAGINETNVSHSTNCQ